MLLLSANTPKNIDTLLKYGAYKHLNHLFLIHKSYNHNDVFSHSEAGRFGTCHSLIVKQYFNEQTGSSEYAKTHLYHLQDTVKLLFLLFFLSSFLKTLKKKSGRPFLSVSYLFLFPDTVACTLPMLLWLEVINNQLHHSGVVFVFFFAVLHSVNVSKINASVSGSEINFSQP